VTGGSIILVGASEGTGLRANPAYAAGKGAILALTGRLARSLWKDNIRVNAIAPGLIREPLKDGAISPPPADLSLGRNPADVAYAALFLASDESAWITGTTLTVDGGFDIGWHLPPPSVRTI